MSVEVKIQVRAAGLAWADMEDMPHFETWEAASDWLKDNGTAKLENFGLRFQIVMEFIPTSLIGAVDSGEVSHER